MPRSLAERSREITIVLLAIGVLAALTVWLLWSLPRSNTLYSARWSQVQFEQLKTGDALEVVLMNLGLPLSLTVNFGPLGKFPQHIESPQKTDIEKRASISGAELVLQYTECRNRFGDFFLDFDVTIQDRKVTEKRVEFYHEWW